MLTCPVETYWSLLCMHDSISSLQELLMSGTLLYTLHVRSSYFVLASRFIVHMHFKLLVHV